MQYHGSLLALVAVWAAVVISPGPCFLAVVQHSSSGSRTTGVFVAQGIAAGTVIWCIGSLLGLALLFARFVWLYNLVRLAGAGYLTYLGIRAILGARRPPPPMPSGKPVSPRAALRLGFITDMSNPKAAAFFSSLFAALLPPAAPLRLIAASVVLVVAIEFGWYCLAACVFSLLPVVKVYRRMKRWLDYTTGAILIGLGLRLAVAPSKQ